MKSFYNVLAVSALALALVVICAPAMAQQAPQTAPEQSPPSAAPPSTDPMQTLMASLTASLNDVARLPGACWVQEWPNNEGMFKIIGRSVWKDATYKIEVLFEIKKTSITNDNAKSLGVEAAAKIKVFVDKVTAAATSGELAKEAAVTPEEQAILDSFSQMFGQAQPSPTLMQKAQRHNASIFRDVYEFEGVKQLLVYVAIPGGDGIPRCTLVARQPLTSLTPDTIPAFVQKVLADTEAFLSTLLIH